MDIKFGKGGFIQRPELAKEPFTKKMYEILDEIGRYARIEIGDGHIVFMEDVKDKDEKSYVLTLAAQFAELHEDRAKYLGGDFIKKTDDDESVISN